MSLLDKGLETLKLNPTENQRRLLDLYLSEIGLWNPKYNLVKVDSEEEIISRHLLDSLSGLSMIRGKTPSSIADLGSGGGFPGIPLAIFMENCRFYLVERSGRRCTFLENALLQLGLDNVEILNRDLKEVEGPFDMLTFRAFRPFEEEILKGMLRILKPGGWVAAYKGRKDKTQEEWQGIKDRFESGEIIPMKVPFSEGERHMLWMRSRIQKAGA